MFNFLYRRTDFFYEGKKERERENMKGVYKDSTIRLVSKSISFIFSYILTTADPGDKMGFLPGYSKNLVKKD